MTDKDLGSCGCNLVVLKLVNTSCKSMYGSEWFIFPLNQLLRAAFADLCVAFVHAWEMTCSLAVPNSSHPGRLIIHKVDFLLSFIYPTWVLLSVLGCVDRGLGYRDSCAEDLSHNRTSGIRAGASNLSPLEDGNNFLTTLAPVLPLFHSEQVIILKHK